MLLGVHHATLRVADVDEAAARWSRLYGLTRAEGRRRHGAPALRLRGLLPRAAPGRRRRAVEHVAYELRSGVSLDDAAARLREAGVDAEEVEVPVRGRGLRLADPDGNPIVLVERVIADDRNPAGRPLHRRAARPFTREGSSTSTT